MLTGDQPNASHVVVATPAVGNRDQTRSCPCECLFDLFFNKINNLDVTDVKVKSTSVLLEFLLCLLNTAYI